MSAGFSITDGLLLGAAIAAWTSVLWFYARAEYRESRWHRLLLLSAAGIACFWLPLMGWLAAALVTWFGLRRAFDFPAGGAWTMTISLLAAYFAVRLLFVVAGPAPPA